MAKAGEIHVRTMNLLAGKIRAGVTTGELDAAAEKFIRSQGATPAFKGYRGFPGSICASPNHMVVHGIPGKFKLRKGDILSVDIGVVKDGWVADGARTFPVGEVSPVAEKLLEVTEQSLFRAVEQCLVGNRLGDVSHAVQTHVEEHGFSVVRSLVGHGIGRSMHEEPQIPNYGPPGKGVVLEEGMVLAIEPMVTAGRHMVRMGDDGWAIYSQDGSLAAHFEFTVAITSAGPRILTPWHEAGARAAAWSSGCAGACVALTLVYARAAHWRSARATTSRRRSVAHAASAAHRPRSPRAAPSAARIAAIVVSRPSHSPRSSQSSRVHGRAPAAQPAASQRAGLERRAAGRVHLARHPARAGVAPAARVAIHGGRSSVIRTTRGRTRRPRPSASSFGSGHVRSRSPGRKYAACDPRARNTTGWPRDVRMLAGPHDSAPACWA